MPDRLIIGLLHLDVVYKSTRDNRAALVAHAQEAAERGAQVIVAPELAVSGYSFDGRGDVAGQVEVLQGETFQALARVALQHGVTICTGLAERDPATGIYYNSAVAIGPDGCLAAFHRKIAAERRWACPGFPSPSSLFDTPWGRMGVLICADTYYGLLPRSMALQGADLLLVPSNWPPSGLDPRKIWRARALENGMGVVACNRTGMDRSMDCREGSSYAVTHEGEILLDGVSEKSRVMLLSYPLANGKLPSAHRLDIMERRRPEDFASVYLHVNGLKDFSGLWGLPPGGPLRIRCLVPSSRGASEEVPREMDPGVNEDSHTLLVLPEGVDSHLLEKLLKRLNGKTAVVAGGVRGASPHAFHPFYACAKGRAQLLPGNPWMKVDFGPARVALVSHETLMHPETVVSLSKEGCDVVVAVGVESLHEDARLVLGVKSLERSVVVAASPHGAIICEPPEGHAPWKETSLNGSGTCTSLVDTAPLRQKTFQDRVNMEILLKPNALQWSSSPGEREG